jgi:hypothetical protein
MEASKRDFVLRSIRLEKYLELSLQKEAQNRGVSANSLISSILEKFDKWDRIAEKFNVITIPEESFKKILDSPSEDTITRTAAELGEWLPRQVMLFWFKDVSQESFKKYLSMLCHHQNLMEYEMDVVGKQETVITVRHGLGRKWSLWLENYLGRAINSNFGIVPEVESSQNSLTIRYSPLTNKID